MEGVSEYISIADALKENFNSDHCFCYLISEDKYRLLRKKGVILCRIITELDNRAKYRDSYFDTVKSESVLKSCGYSVSAKDGLSKIQRETILKLVVENKLYSKNELQSFISWLIHQNHHAKKRIWF